jgi:hypothetical protein
MSNAGQTPEKIRRDFVFLVSGVPAEMRISHEHHTFANLGEVERREIEKIAVNYSELANWMKRAGKGVSVAVFRNEFCSETDGFAAAFGRLSSILDGYTFLTEDTTPEVSPLVLIRERDERDAYVKLFSHRATVRWGKPSEDATSAWRERKNMLMQRWLVFFDSVTGDAGIETEIVKQLGLSARMFRHGQRAVAYDVEYLCKFTALEGLVCGSRKNGHRQLLTTRLPLLFKTWPGLDEEVKRLWGFRCAASHQGNSSHSQMSTLIQPVEKLTLGVMVFALDNLKEAKTTDELWNRVSSYTLPDQLTIDHPQYAAVVTHLMGDVGIWRSVGVITDHVFEELKLQRQAGPK